MLPDLAAEALQFLTRRDLDKACAVSKWLDSLLAQCCGVYPLRPVFRIELRSRSSGDSNKRRFGTYLPQRPVIFIYEEGKPGMSYPCISTDDVVCHGSSVLRHSYVDTLQVIHRTALPRVLGDLLIYLKQSAYRRFPLWEMPLWFAVGGS